MAWGARKMAVSQPNAPREIEANRIAARVTSASGSTPDAVPWQPASARGSSDTSGSYGFATGKPLGASAGAPLDRATRAYFEPRLGAPLDHVRVHRGDSAAQAARALHAQAFTVGADIVLGRGRGSFDSAEGRHLLAHELVHTLQHGDDQGNTIHRQVETGPDQGAEPTAPFDTPYCSRFRDEMKQTCDVGTWDLIKEWSSRKCCDWYQFSCKDRCDRLPEESRDGCIACCKRAACVCVGNGGTPIEPEGGCEKR